MRVVKDLRNCGNAQGTRRVDLSTRSNKVDLTDSLNKQKNLLSPRDAIWTPDRIPYFFHPCNPGGEFGILPNSVVEGTVDAGA